MEAKDEDDPITGAIWIEGDSGASSEEDVWSACVDDYTDLWAIDPAESVTSIFVGLVNQDEEAEVDGKAKVLQVWDDNNKPVSDQEWGTFCTRERKCKWKARKKMLARIRYRILQRQKHVNVLRKGNQTTHLIDRSWPGSSWTYGRSLG